MYLNLFFKIIAGIFLFFFLLKLISTKSWKSILHFFPYTFFLLIKSSLYTIHLLFRRTVYVIGLDLIFAFFINLIIIIIVHPQFDLNMWWYLFKRNAFSSYVLSFFVFTYIIGLYHYLNNKHFIKEDFFHFIHKKINNREVVFDEDENIFHNYK